MADRPELSIAQIVEQFEITRTTLRRRIESGAFPNAHRLDSGKWLVPVDDLIAAGLPARKTWLQADDHQGGQSSDQSADGQDHGLAIRVRELELQLEAERRVREAMEVRAENAERALRMIEATIPKTAAAAASAPAPAAPAEAAPASEPGRRGFLGWLRRSSS